MTDMTLSTEVEKAYGRWCSVHGMNEFWTFWKYIGVDPAVHMSPHYGYALDDETRQRILNLNGRHGMTLIKAAFHARKK